MRKRLVSRKNDESVKIVTLREILVLVVLLVAALVTVLVVSPDTIFRGQMPAVAGTTISSCMNIVNPGVYVLDTDNPTLQVSNDCFTFDTDDVVIDCQGHIIVGPKGYAFGDAARMVARKNITI
ncbi:MAG: hypothetical protein ABIA21_01095, partial [Candidatus Aenigmatarchaeota archaeon]